MVSLALVWYICVVGCPQQQFRFDIDPLRDLLVLRQVFNRLHETGKGPAFEREQFIRISASWAYSSAIDITFASMCPSAQVEKLRAIPRRSWRCISICRNCPSFDGWMRSHQRALLLLAISFSFIVRLFTACCASRGISLAFDPIPMLRRGLSLPGLIVCLRGG